VVPAQEAPFSVSRGRPGTVRVRVIPAQEAPFSGQPGRRGTARVVPAQEAPSGLGLDPAPDG